MNRSPLQKTHHSGGHGVIADAADRASATVWFMAIKKVSLRVPASIEVGNVDVEFEVRDGMELMGTVAISRGGIDWRARGKRSATSVTWKQFAEQMAPTPDPARRAGPATPHRPAVTSPAPAVDARTIRAWAAAKGISVNPRGKLSASLIDRLSPKQAVGHREPRPRPTVPAGRVAQWGHHASTRGNMQDEKHRVTFGESGRVSRRRPARSRHPHRWLQ